MNFYSSLAMATALGVAILPLGVAEAQRLVGVTWANDPFVTIDPATGAFSSLADTSPSYNALAVNSRGELFAGGRLARISSKTGQPLETFDVVLPEDRSLRGLAFDASDTLYAVADHTSQQGEMFLDELYRIDLQDQSAEFIGDLGFTGVQSIEFSPEGILYGWDIGDGLLVIDPTTGAAEDLSQAVGAGGTVRIQSLAFSPGGELFGARSQLYSIDTTTGRFTEIGSGDGPDVRGIAFVIPEPASLALVMFTATLSALCRSRRRAW